MSNKKNLKRYICPICKREYKKLGWYKRHCENKHTGYIPPKVKKIVDKKDIDHIFHKIESLESKIDSLLTQGIPIQHDIDIRSIQSKIQPSIKLPETPLTACINDLKNVFSKGLNILRDMEDATEEEKQFRSKLQVTAKVKEKTDEELEEAQKLAKERAKKRLEKKQKEVATNG